MMPLRPSRKLGEVINSAISEIGKHRKTEKDQVAGVWIFDRFGETDLRNGIPRVRKKAPINWPRNFPAIHLAQYSIRPRLNQGRQQGFPDPLLI